MSDEDEGKLAEYIEAKGPEFPIIRAQGVLEAFGGRGYPTFVTIGPDGTIAEGDRVPSKSTLAKLGRRSKVLPDLPAAYKGLRKPWQKRNWAEVQKQLRAATQDELDDDDRAVIDALTRSVEGRIAAAESSIDRLAKGPDFYKATEAISRIADDFDGLPVAHTAETKLIELRDDPEIAAEIKLGKSLHRLLDKYDASKQSQRKKLITALEKFGDKHGGTKAAEIAASKLEKLRKQR